jgi:hypothetical protein
VLLTGGSYEHPLLGTVLQGVEVEIAGDASRLVITQARATDGRNGLLTLSGFLNLAPEDVCPLALDPTSAIRGGKRLFCGLRTA